MLNTRSLLRAGAVLASSTVVVALGMAPASATHDATSQAEADAVVGTGLFAAVESLITEGSCVATNDETQVDGVQSGNCTPSIDANPAQAITQFATADADGISSAEAGTAEVPIDDLAFALDLTDLIDALGAMDSGALLAGLGDVITTLDGLGLLDELLGPVDSLLGGVLDSVGSSLPVHIAIGAVFSECSATPTSAEGSSTIAGIDLTVDLGGQQIAVPITLDTAPNSNLLVGAPQDLVNGLLDGISDTLTQSLGGALSPLVTAVVSVQDIVNQLLDELEPVLLQQLADALEALISGTVNVQEPVSPDTVAPYEIRVAALELTVLGTNTLTLADVHCGVNTAGTPHEPTPPPTDGPEEPEVPTVIDAGSGGNSAGMVAALALLGAAVGVAGHRVRRSFI